MNSDEQTLIDGLFSRLQQAEKDGGPRDALAEQRIKDHVARQPSAAYYMTQAILVQEAALKRMDQQNKQLQQDLADARAQAQAQPAAQPQSGGFLSNLFGGGSRDPAPAPAPSAGGWREPARPSAYGGQPQPQQPQQPYYPPQQPAAAPAGGGFMSGALKTAAGVAGGVMLAEGISSLFHHNQPQEIVEVIKEEPSQFAGNNNDDWGNGDQRNVGNDSWANQDPGGFSNTDFNSTDDGGGFFSDDDDYV